MSKAARRSSLLLLAIAMTARIAAGDSTINTTQKFAWAANAGWINFRPSTADGLIIGEYVCSGFAWGANFGWINFGLGTPQNGIAYSNASGTDFGVNLQPGGLLRGYAWAANAGWIQFEPAGNPRVDLATGSLRGYVWSSNLGWINLDDLTYSVKTDNILPGVDSDNDGITDAWELQKAGNLTSLGSPGDFDGDGVKDSDEYVADSNPTNGASFLRISGFKLSPQPGPQAQITWSSSPARNYFIEARGGLDTGLWTNLNSGPLPGAAGTQTQSFSVAPAIQQQFYRVRVVLPLP